MALIQIEPVSSRSTKADILRLVCETGGLERKRVGKIELRGSRATVEVPDDRVARLVVALDGAALGDKRIRARAQSASQTSDPKDHFARLARLLALESSEELRRAAQSRQRAKGSSAERSGEALVDLVVADEDAGLGGRYILSLVKRNRTLKLPWHRLNPGTPVIVSCSGEASEFEARGVVCERNERMLRVVTERQPEDTDEGAWRVDLARDEVASERQRAALDRASSARGDRLADLRRLLLGEREPRFDDQQPSLAWELPLNESQREAVRHALAAQDVALIHGPPGTGKTTAVVEVVRQAARRGEKVLVTAPSNLAVDNLLERLVALGEPAVRLGHPARVLEGLRQHTLDYLVDEHHDIRLARKLVKEAWALFRRASRYTRAKPEPGARQQLRDEARGRLADARRLEAQAVESILDNARVICATTTGLDSQVIGQRTFDLVVIDEACQSTEPGCWPAVVRAERLVLAGDHCQLPPTVVSSEAVDQGLGVSLFERLVALHGNSITRRLDVQYRMHEQIMAFSSREFYDDTLLADPSVAEHLLGELEGVEILSPLTDTPLEFIDTAGAGYDEEPEPEGESRSNPEEARVVAAKVAELLAAGLPGQSIAVIAPYAAQVRLLRERIEAPEVEVDSVDGFQGREKEAVIISLVRSNPRGEVGFLAEVRRMNVAMTRARRKLIVVGDSATLSAEPFFARWLEFVEQSGGYRTVWEM